MNNKKCVRLATFEKKSLNRLPQKTRNFYDIDGQDVFAPHNAIGGHFLQTVETVSELLESNQNDLVGGHFSYIEFQ